MRPEGAVLSVVQPTFVYRLSGRNKCVGVTTKYRSECEVLDSPTKPIFLAQAANYFPLCGRSNLRGEQKKYLRRARPKYFSNSLQKKRPQRITRRGHPVKESPELE